MFLANEQYRVLIKTEYSTPLEGYPVVYQPEDLNFDDFYTARFITVESADGPAFRVAVLAFLAASIEPCAVLEGNMLVMILFRTILRIDLCTRSVVQCVDCENMGGLEDGYLIKGECDIFRYDKTLNRIWHYSGRDILATPKGECSFWIDGDQIHCRDWQGWHNVLDMQGKVISEVAEKVFVN